MTTPIACARPSTLAKALTDQGGSGLRDYDTGTALETIFGHEDLLHTAQMVDPADGWRGYRPVLAEARRRRGKREANAGSNIHGALQSIAEGRDVSRFPAAVLAPARLALAELEALGMEVVASERFTAALGVWDEPVGGTADLILRHGDRLIIGDLKTTERLGKAKFAALEWSLQLSCYANGRPATRGYAPGRDRWGRPLVHPGDLIDWPQSMDRTAGVVIEVARDGTAAVSHRIALDPDHVALAVAVRAARKRDVLARAT